MGTTHEDAHTPRVLFRVVAADPRVIKRPRVLERDVHINDDLIGDGVGALGELEIAILIRAGRNERQHLRGDRKSHCRPRVVRVLVPRLSIDRRPVRMVQAVRRGVAVPSVASQL